MSRDLTRLLDDEQMDRLAALIDESGFTAVLLGIEELALNASRDRQGGNVGLEGVASALRQPILLAKVSEPRR